MADGIPRKIIFYQLYCEETVEDEGKKTKIEHGFDADAWLSHCKSLKPQTKSFDKNSRYWENAQNIILASWVHRLQAPFRMRFVKVRRDAIPLLDDAGVLKPLGIKDGDGLAEPCHMVFFDDGIVGVEQNWHGPSMRMLADYLSEKTPNLPYTVHYRHLVEHSQYETLGQIVKGRKVVLKVSNSYVSTLAKAGKGGLANAIRASFKSSNGTAETVTLELGVGKTRDAVLDDTILQECKQLAEGDDYWLAAERGELLQFRVEGRKEDRELIKANMLDDRLLKEFTFARLAPDTNAVDPKQVFAKIEAIYNKGDFKKRIENALRIE